jgi:hypothetical protein
MQRHAGEPQGSRGLRAPYRGCDTPWGDERRPLKSSVERCHQRAANSASRSGQRVQICTLLLRRSAGQGPIIGGFRAQTGLARQLLYPLAEAAVMGTELPRGIKRSSRFQ